MPITYPRAPEGGHEIVERELRQRLPAQRIAGAGLMSNVRAESISLAAPHLSYFVRLDDLAKGRLLAAARPTAWRYVIVHNNGAAGEMELTRPAAENMPPSFSALHETPFAAASLAALAEAAKLAPVRNKSYELRYLKIPAVYFAALWLHGEDDLIIPLLKAPNGLKENTAYSEKTVLSALRPVARQALAFERRSNRRPK